MTSFITAFCNFVSKVVSYVKGGQKDLSSVIQSVEKQKQQSASYVITRWELSPQLKTRLTQDLWPHAKTFVVDGRLHGEQYLLTTDDYSLLMRYLGYLTTTSVKCQVSDLPESLILLRQTVLHP